MLEKKQPRAIILENNEVVLHSAKSMLSKQGWDVTCETVSINALQTLKSTKKKPIALFITNFRLPKMTGDDILEQVKKISPLTRRMIMVSPDEPEIFISAINRALVHACITAPFQEEDLIYHSRNCFQEFKKQIKKQRLKRVTQHQNQQMFKIAQKLKQKDESFQKSIKEKKTRIAQLQSKKKEIENQILLKSVISLASYIKNKGIRPSPDIFLEEFMSLCQTIGSIFSLAADDSDINADLSKIFKEADKKDDASDLENIDQNDHREDTQTSFYKDFLGLILAKALNLKEMALEEDFIHKTQLDDAPEDPMDGWFALTISEDQTSASLTKKREYDPPKSSGTR